MSVQYYRKYELEGSTYGVVYRDDSNNFGKVLALRDNGELERRVSTLKYLDYIISKEGIEARVERTTNIKSRTIVFWFDLAEYVWSTLGSTTQFEILQRLAVKGENPHTI